MADENLAPKLILSLVKPERGWSFYIIASSQISKEKCLSKAYLLASKDKVKDTANLLKSAITKAHSESEDMEWPPDPDKLKRSENILPADLEFFLNILISGKTENLSEKSKRLVLSIGQDICRAATNGLWKMPKHVLLCETLRHLYRSKRLLTILNRLGHCESHWFALELENALNKAIEETSPTLPASIVSGPENLIIHSEFDNYDLKLKGAHGAPSIHLAAGIMLQEVADIDDPPPPVTLKRKQRKLTSHAKKPGRQLQKKSTKSYDPLAPFFLRKADRVGPKFDFSDSEPEGDAGELNEDELPELPGNESPTSIGQEIIIDVIYDIIQQKEI